MTLLPLLAQQLPGGLVRVDPVSLPLWIETLAVGIAPALEVALIAFTTELSQVTATTAVRP
jgi:hypothetical protein